MLSKIEELALIARCVAADDRRAFGRLVEEYSPGLRHFVFNLTMGDAALTDDSSDLVIADRRMDVERAMAELTEVEQTLVLLFYYNDLPIKKVAAITELPEGTVKVYLSRARAKMATVLKEC